MHIKNHKKGFTLIEIVVIIAILAILALIAIPRISGYSEKAKINADKASLNTLNKATMMYAALKNKSSEDIFAEVTSDEDEERMGVLVGDGLLEKVIKPQQKEKKFMWDRPVQIWTMDNLDGLDPEGPEGPEDPDPEGMTVDQAIAAGFIFEKIGETYTITGYDENKGGPDVKIPPKIDGLPVTKIGRRAFAGTYNIVPSNFKRSGITSVVIPESVTEIGDKAFKYGNLTSVTIEGSSTIIGEEAFWSNILPLDIYNIPPFFEDKNPQGTWITTIFGWRRQ